MAFDFQRRESFLSAALLFEGSLVLVAYAIGYFTHIDPLARWTWNWQGLAWGLAATGPMFALFLLMQRYPLGPLRGIRDFLIDHLGPILANCRWYDLIFVAVLAGVTEELLFRGVLQPWWGLGWSNVAFGLVHSVTPTYALLAGGVGLYLGWILELSHNLLAPTLAHGLYDYLAFLVVLSDWRKRQQPSHDGALVSARAS